MQGSIAASRHRFSPSKRPILEGKKSASCLHSCGCARRPSLLLRHMLLPSNAVGIRYIVDEQRLTEQTTPMAIERQTQISPAQQQKVLPAVRTSGSVSTMVFVTILPKTCTADTAVQTRPGSRKDVLRTCAHMVGALTCSKRKTLLICSRYDSRWRRVDNTVRRSRRPVVLQRRQHTRKMLPGVTVTTPFLRATKRKCIRDDWLQSSVD